MKHTFLLSVFLFGLLLLPAKVSFSAELDVEKIDSVVTRTMEAFQVPGMAVCVVENGKIVFSKGYGVRRLGEDAPVGPTTNFAIASNSKAFTCVCLGILADEKKISWDDPVTNYIPEFRLYSPFVTEEFTIRDLLCHRSGLGLGAGDLMIFPDSGDYTADEVIHNMRYLKPVSSFRSKYDYDNLLYIVAGEVVARVSGMSWEDFIEQRIMQPLEMDRSASHYTRLTGEDAENIVSPHGVIEGELIVMDRYKQRVVGAAGGIYSNTEDLAKWQNMFLNGGKYGENLEKQLISKEVRDELWKPQTIMSGGMSDSIYDTHFNCYALGFRVNDVKGEYQVGHTGGVPGIWTELILLPERNVGIIVLTNQQVSEAFRAVTNSIKDMYLDVQFDWVEDLTVKYQDKKKDAREVEEKVWQDVASVQSDNEGQKTDLTVFTGIYQDPWFGEVEISENEGQLQFVSKRSSKMTGPMFPYKGQTMIVKWTDREMEADAYVKFELDYQGKAAGFKMAPVSPLVDFSWDYQDLDFSLVK